MISCSVGTRYSGVTLVLDPCVERYGLAESFRSVDLRTSVASISCVEITRYAGSHTSSLSVYRLPSSHAVHDAARPIV